MFKKMLASMGAGGASVQTTLPNPSVYPGGTLEGTIDIAGGSVDQSIEYVSVELVARVEVESGDSEYDAMVGVHKQKLTGAFELKEGGRHQLPFQFQIPWETPFNVIGGHQLPKCFVGLRTELEIKGAIDKTDVDQLHVYALPAHERLLSAFANLGFRFAGADMERGRVPGATLPFYQEIEFHPGGQYAGAFNQLEVTFVTRPTDMEVILEVDKRGGFLTEGTDQIVHFDVRFDQVEHFDWEGTLNNTLSALGRRRGLFG